MFQKLFIIILPLFFFIDSAYAESFKLDKNKSKITYSLTKFGIPFKVRTIPAEGQIIAYNKDHPLSRKQLFLEAVNLKATFTSKLPLFRKIIDYDKYPHLLFSSKIESPLIISNPSENFNLNGYLTFHGVSKKITIKLNCKSNNDLIILKGFFNVKMTDFGIKPPKILFIPLDNVIKTKIELYIPIFRSPAKTHNSDEALLFDLSKFKLNSPF